MPEWLAGMLMGSVGISAMTYICTKYLPNSRFRAWGIPLGKSISAAGRRKMGKSKWEKIETQVLEKTAIGGVISFVDGIRIGLNADDKI